MERIQKILAEAGLCSRRAAEKLIRAGRVSLDGQPAVLGQKADPLTVKIEVDGQPLAKAPQTAVYLFHKPVGVITTLSDPQNRPCLAQFVDGLPVRVFPVGRLDADASGLLLLTNDGELANRLAHPSHGVDKTYHALVRGRADKKALAQLEAGVLIGRRKSAPAQAEVLERLPNGRCLLGLTIHEGRHHQVKRMCGQVGLRVEALTRVGFGPLGLGRLKPGRLRSLNPTELSRLRQAAGL